ncbi:MAG: acetate/propionate family kinase [Acidobacteriia bacterium]|nr:acetate/propionate family kinase [Terriglobia bacterium]
MRILALNGGSSSFKCRLDDVSADPPSAPPKPVWQASVERGADLQKLFESLPKPVDLVGHRIVHGGKFRHSTRITAEVHAEIAREAEVAPAHNQYELEAIDTVERIFNVPQIAVFDAAFHATLDRAAYVYPGPYEWLDQGIRRYGFHGISHQYASRRAAEIIGRTDLRLVTCHLGNGASLAAVRDGRSSDTTMGFTPLEGLMMGTRSGSIDPGILIDLIRERGYTGEQLDRVLNQESGLLGISGISGDMREVLAAVEAGNDRARLAFEIYAHRLCREIGAMIGVLGGADALVFTGGVGENCAPLREIAQKRFAFLDAKVLVIHAEEEWEIVRECRRIADNNTVTLL